MVKINPLSIRKIPCHLLREMYLVTITKYAESNIHTKYRCVKHFKSKRYTKKETHGTVRLFLPELILAKVRHFLYLFLNLCS